MYDPARGSREKGKNMLFGKKDDVINENQNQESKEVNLIKLGLTVAGGVVATVAGVYVGKKIYQTYYNPVDEVDCSNLPEEPLEESAFNEVGDFSEDMPGEKVVDFSEVTGRESNPPKEDQVRHELKDILGPLEVRISAFDAGDDFGELFSIAESGCVSDNEETSKYEWNGGDVEVEPDNVDEDNIVSESHIESMNTGSTTSSDEIAATQELSVEEDSSPNKEAIDEFNSLVESLKKKMKEKPSEALRFYRDNLKCYLVDDNISDKTKQMLKSMEDKIIDNKYEKYENARKYMASQKGGRRHNKKRSGRR